VTAQAAAAIPPDQARAAAEDVLAGPEFAQRGPGFFERALAWIADLLEGILPDGLGLERDALLTALHVVVWVVVALVALAVLRFVWLALRRRERPGAAGAAPDPEAERRERVARLRRAARAAEARGELVLAMRLEFTALVVGLGQRGDLEYREAFTNRELLERGRPGAEAERMLRPLVPELDRKSFGGEPAAPGDVARIAALCDRWLGAARA
jgi:hypothetical protein